MIDQSTYYPLTSDSALLYAATDGDIQTKLISTPTVPPTNTETGTQNGGHKRAQPDVQASLVPAGGISYAWQ
ncbi:hypothetical protein GCK32_013541 [Trichostrongylus colubriformis]|uniref:Uncharacterized protein n=1 Tax=Trichostrongylus colubriformis TaxID=6319 RepID=A0AAN8FYQ2_TRICO